MWNSNFSFKRFSSNDFGLESGAFGYCCTIGKMGIVFFQYHGSGSSFTIKFPIQFVKEELYVSIVDNDSSQVTSAYSNIKIGWYSQTGYTGIQVNGVSPGFTGFAIGAII